MSQNGGKFQSKGKKFGGGGKHRGGAGGGGFKKRFEGDRDGFKGGGGKRFDRDGGGGGKFEGRGGRPRFKDRDSGQSREGAGDRPFKKREWSNDREGGYKGKGGDRPFKKPFRDRDDRGGGDFKGRGGDDFKGHGGDKPYKKREWSDRGGGDFKSREGGFKGGGDRPFKKNFRDRDDRGGGGFKPRREGGDFKRREDGDRPFKKREWNNDETRHPQGRRHFGAKKGKGDFDRRPRRARDFDLDEDTFDLESNVATNSAETRSKLKSDRPSYGSPSSAFLYGAHAVRAALLNPKRLHQRLLVTPSGYEAIQEAYEQAQGDGQKLPQPTYVENIDIERLLPRDAVHQGILLDSQPQEEIFLADILVSAPDNAKILVLDQVTDPHNVGAILRSAAAFGAAAVVMQKLHAPEITGTLAKAASGAVEHVPVVREVNLTRALEQLKEAGYFCIGLAEEGKSTLAELHSSGKVALVMGAEGDGLRRLVAETCDVLAKLPTGGPVSSLNVSNAAAVALYELVRGSEA